MGKPIVQALILKRTVFLNRNLVYLYKHDDQEETCEKFKYCYSIRGLKLMKRNAKKRNKKFDVEIM